MTSSYDISKLKSMMLIIYLDSMILLSDVIKHRVLAQIDDIFITKQSW